MKAGRTLGIVACLFVSSLFCRGCASAPTLPEAELPKTKQELLSYLLSGYDETYPRLYYDYDPSRGSRFLPWLRQFGWPSGIEPHPVPKEVPSDGGSVRFRWGRGPCNYLIVRKDGAPRVVTAPGRAWLDDSGNILGWWDREARVRVFHTGHRIPYRGTFSGDNAGKFFCDGGQIRDPNDGRYKYTRVNIYSASDPTVALATSKFKRAVRHIYTTESELYLLRSQGKRYPRDLHVEVYNHKDGKLTFQRTFVVECPHTWGAINLTPMAFNGVNKQIFLYIHASAHCPSPRYIYDMKTDKLTRINTVDPWRWPIFLDPEVLVNIVKYVDLPEE